MLKTFLLVLLMLLGIGPPAWAALGGQALAQQAGPETSQTPRSYRIASVPSTRPATSFSENIITTSTGTVMREYVNGDGVVFAVHWQGPVLPDLSALFGDYFQDFKARAELHRASRKRGAPIAIASDDLVMLSRGRMGRFSGHAYVPALIPAGVNIHDLLP